MGRKRKNYYFTDVTEKAIIRYNNEERPAMRNRIYNDHIKDALINYVKISFTHLSFIILMFHQKKLKMK